LQYDDRKDFLDDLDQDFSERLTVVVELNQISEFIKFDVHLA
jgi:hypothetical protein